MPAHLTVFHLIFLPVLGIVTGAAGAIVGVGGGFILVPVLLFLFPESSPATITSISLAVILLNAGSGTLGYLRQRWVDIRTGLVLTATAVPASVAGALATGLVSRKDFELIFGSAMVRGAFYILGRSTARQTVDQPSRKVPNRVMRDCQDVTYSFHVDQKLAALISPVAGFVASFLGIGGGVIHMPALVLLLRMPARIAAATTLFVLVFTSLSGVLVHVAAGQFHYGWRRAGLLGIGVLIGAYVGTHLASRVNPRVLMVVLSIGLIAAGVRQVVAGLV